MSVLIGELEKLLTQIVAEHRTLLGAVQRHLDAMKMFQTDTVTVAADAVEASRLRVMLLETRRRGMMAQVIRTHQLPADVSLRQIADFSPPHRLSLNKLREELSALTTEISRRTGTSAKVAGALLGHLNTVVRIVAGAMSHAAVYTKQGVPTVATRIGVMEAVG